MARVKILNEVPEKYDANGWTLCFQWCEYIYDNGEPSQNGYRFIWRRPDGSLQPARGQARIPSIAEMKRLLRLADETGWLEKVEKF
jgi:hypothetical protein